jgi:hypothetical protein
MKLSLVMLIACALLGCTTKFEEKDAQDVQGEDDQDVQGEDALQDDASTESGADGYDIEIEPGAEPAIIIDDTDYQPFFDFTGEWMELDTPQAYNNRCLYANPRLGTLDTPEATATFNPDLPEAGLYAVFIWWPDGDDRATDAPIFIHHAEGIALRQFNLRSNGNQWRRLGVFRFNAGSEGKVVLWDSKTGYTNADAVGFLHLDL